MQGKPFDAVVAGGLALEEYVNTNQKFLEDIQEFLIKAKERRNA